MMRRSSLLCMAASLLCTTPIAGRKSSTATPEGSSSNTSAYGMNEAPQTSARTAVPVVLALLCVLLPGTFWVLMQGGAEPQVVPQTAAERGRALAAAQGCVACHTLDGTRGIGPSWQGSFGSMRTFVDGGSAVVNEAYLYTAMREPAAQLVNGYDNVMLPVALSDAQLADLIALIKELGVTAP